jgi:hypothetical protein
MMMMEIPMPESSHREATTDWARLLLCSEMENFPLFRGEIEV